MTPNLLRKLHVHVAASFDKQLHFADLISGLRWNFSMQTGTLSFGDQYSWRAEILGTESYETNSWLWSWANEESNIPKGLVATSHTLLDIGVNDNIAEFIAPQLPFGRIDGHTLALIASGISGAKGYFRGPYDGGAVFLLVMDEEFPSEQIEHPFTRIASVFPQTISMIDVPDHKFAFVEYLRYYGFEAAAANNSVLVRNSADNVLSASFDEQSRLIHLDVTANS